MTVGLIKLYYTLTAHPFVTPLEAVAAWLYLLAPELQALDTGIFGTIGQILSAGSPVLVGVAMIMLYRRDVVSKATLLEAVAKEKEEREKAEAKAAAAHTAELAALRAAQQREREQFEANIQEKRVEIEQWQQRWAKAAGGAERAVELLLQQKAT